MIGGMVNRAGTRCGGGWRIARLAGGLRWVAALAVAVAAAGCVTRLPLELGDRIRGPEDVDTERLRARLDRDGDDRFDQELPVAPFTFNHAADVVPFIEAAGMGALHTRLSYDTGTSIVIPAGHPVDALLNVLLSSKAMAAHGLLVLEDAADTAGLRGVGDVLARAGRDQTVDASETVTLDGSDSLSFVEGAALSYNWEQMSGEAVELTEADTAVATFVAPAVDVQSDLHFLLTVTAGGDRNADDVVVTVSGAAPDDGGDDAGDGDAGAVAGEAAYAGAGCGACHGADASGGSGPGLQGGDRQAALDERFGDGGDHFGTTLTEQEIADIAAWLATLE